ncbi:MAG: DUF6766 family protein [Pyrinomonadaceae bacterium]
MQRFIRNQSLSIVLFSLFVLFLIGQSIAGHLQQNEELNEHGQPSLTYTAYLGSSHFLEATMENWESEFLQMFSYVALTAFLFQKGSLESKDPDKTEPVDRDPRKGKNRRNLPWPVKKGGLILILYEYSLSLVFLLLFLMSFFLHAVGGASTYNQGQIEHGQPAVSLLGFMATSEFWFQSLQNWQSEFLAVGCMVVFSIFLRQRWSAESKPVDAPHSETGD